ncbi:MAG: RNA polymerase sigma factor [bacterium]|nr:RNA polymerase sigma factor [bacterium]
MKTAYHFTGSWDDAEDITQTTFIKAYYNLAKFDVSRPFRPWLFQIHLNNCRSFYRRRRWELLLRMPLQKAEAKLTGKAADPDSEEKIRAQIDRLSWQQRAAFLLHEVEGYPPEECAESMKCSVATFRVHLFRAKQTLQKRLR